MGASPALDLGQRLLPPDTPPELVSPGATTYSSRSSPATEAAWSARPLASPPMSDYDKGSAKAVAAAALPGEKGAVEAASTNPPAHSHSQSASRQQLPSLSSLFGPPSARPQPSPGSDRNGLPMASPMDRPRFPSSSNSHNPRTHGDSYFPPTLSPPISQPRTSYDSKFESETPSIGGLRHLASGSASPGFRALNHARPDSRSDDDAHYHHKWAPSPQDAGKGEYALEPRDSSFRSSRDHHFRLQFPSRKEAGPGFPEHRLSTSGQNPPATPPSMTTSEGVSTKDGLGPKIWTGTHFLPRFVRAAEVPGEGMCYFYDDGSHCKTVIDGEAVNAHWGVTKAGKPRKRLAIACITCREKKIKCDPDYPRCVQCEKFGRICKFKNAPRGGHSGSPSTPPDELDEPGKLTVPPPRPNGYRHSESEAGSPLSPRTALAQATTDGGSGHKRLKIDREGYTASGEPSPAMPRPLDHSKSRITTPMPPPEVARIPEDVLNRAWRTDPYVTDPHSIMAVVSQFFAHVDSTMILQILPERSTKAWVAGSAHRKSLEDLMLLYSILAVGVTLSGGPKHIASEYAQVAHYGQKKTMTCCLQVAQSRILLAVYYISAARPREALEVMSAAAATVSGLQLNVELDKTREARLPTFPLGLNRAGYSESRRRALWSLFMLERLSGVFPERMALINPENVYIRLPADLRVFEEQLENRSPLFDPLEPSLSRTPDQPQESAAYLVEMVHLWAESQSSIYQLVHRPTSREAEDRRIRRLVGAMDHWQSVLPTRLVSGRGTLESAALGGQVGSFLTMHLLYNHAVIKLHRHSRASHHLPVETRRSHIHKCQVFAAGIVDMIDNLETLLRARPMSLSVPPPMVAVAVAEAVDVLSASRPLAALDKVIDGVSVMKPLVDTMSNMWEESRDVRHAIDRRLHLLNRIRERASHSPRPVEGFRIVSKRDEQRDETSFHWEIFEPIECLYGRDMDIFYLGAS